MDRRSVSVDGMACGGCEENVENAVGALPGITRVEADHETGEVEVVAEDDVADATVREAVEDAGYEVVA